jgi:hypothetical protein
VLVFVEEIETTITITVHEHDELKIGDHR